jgi:hypothetical protein
MSPLEENLNICKSCKNKIFDIKSGILCDITGMKPSFEKNCSNYLQDINSELEENRYKITKRFSENKSFNDYISFIIKAFPNFKAEKKEENKYKINNSVFYFVVKEKQNNIKIDTRFPAFYTAIILIICFSREFIDGGLLIHIIYLIIYISLLIMIPLYFLLAKKIKIEIMDALVKYINENK